jgi:hypothetical protein
MTKAAFLANWYIGPLKGAGHRQDPKSENPAHGWHWVQETDEGWECVPLVPSKARHFQTPQQAIDHARAHGFEIYDHPELNTKFAIIPQGASPPANGD